MLKSNIDNANIKNKQMSFLINWHLKVEVSINIAHQNGRLLYINISHRGVEVEMSEKALDLTIYVPQIRHAISNT